jgi:ABC-type phosphate/phosphonate transport system substrate-binding protein
VLGVVSKYDAELAAELRVIATLGPAPSQPVVVRAGLAPDIKSGVQERLLGLNNPVLRQFGVAGFAPAPDYSQIAAIVAAATNDRR